VTQVGPLQFDRFGSHPWPPSNSPWRSRAIVSCAPALGDRFAVRTRAASPRNRASVLRYCPAYCGIEFPAATQPYKKPRRPVRESKYVLPGGHDSQSCPPKLSVRPMHRPTGGSNDQENFRRLSGFVGKGKEPGWALQDKTTGRKAPPASGIFQT